MPARRGGWLWGHGMSPSWGTAPGHAEAVSTLLLAPRAPALQHPTVITQQSRGAAGEADGCFCRVSSLRDGEVCREAKQAFKKISLNLKAEQYPACRQQPHPGTPSSASPRAWAPEPLPQQLLHHPSAPTRCHPTFLSLNGASELPVTHHPTSAASKPLPSIPPSLFLRE